MSNKSAVTYEKVFTYIENNIFKLEPAMFMCDFETGLRAAINKLYPNSALHGCWYHYSVCIRSRFIQLNMYRLITENLAARKIYKKMLRLPLLPTQSILEGFEIIKTESRAMRLFREFKSVFQYFEGFWIKLVRLFNTPNINKNTKL